MLVRSVVVLVVIFTILVLAPDADGTERVPVPALAVGDVVEVIDGVPIVVESVSGDLVVFSAQSAPLGRSEATARSGSTTSSPPDGYTLLGDLELLDAYEVRLVASAGIEQIRPTMVAAATDAARSGVGMSVRPGTVPAMGPDVGQIDLVVSSSSPCSGRWLACGGPTGFTGSIRSGRIWVHPRLLSRSSNVVASALRHELGHTLGLGHHDARHHGEVQVMHSRSLAATTFRSGDRAGILSLKAVPPEITIDETNYAAGVLAVGGAVTGDRGGHVHVSHLAERRPATVVRGVFGAGIRMDAGRHEVCATVVSRSPRRADACQTVDVPGDPFGAVNSITPTRLGVTVDGWAVDPQTDAPIVVGISVDGTLREVVADRDRPDVGRAHHGYGPAHGFRHERILLPGAHEVCVVAVNVAGGSDTDLGCETIRVGMLS